MATRVPKATRSAEEEEFVKLGWKLIEWKVAYYEPQSVHPSRREGLTIDDGTYDAYEQRYLTLCRQLGKPNTVVHKVYPGFPPEPHDSPMMEIDKERPSVQLVLFKLGSPQR